MVISELMNKVLIDINKKIYQTGADWLIGGSCGLLLQKVSLTNQPRDLDIYVDQQQVQHVSELLQDYAIDQLKHSETGMYRSYLSHYDMDGVQVELVGGFQVEVKGAYYCVEVSDLMMKYSFPVSLRSHCIRLMPLAHELVFNVLRNRPDRYRCIAEVMKSNKDLYLPPLIEIVERNQFNQDFLDKFDGLLN